MPNVTRSAAATLLLAALGLALVALSIRAQDREAPSSTGLPRVRSMPWSNPQALRELGPDDTARIPELIRLLIRPEPTWRQAAGRALARMGDPAREALVRTLRVADGPDRPALEQALALHGPEAILAVRPLLASPRADDRDRALGVLLQLGPAARDTTASLLALVPRAGAVEQERLACVLAGVGPGVFPALEKGLGHEQRHMRHVCARALVLSARMWGPAARGARTALVRVAAAPASSLEPALADTAAEALLDLDIPAATLADDLRAAVGSSTPSTPPPEEELAEACLHQNRAATRLLAALDLARAGPRGYTVLKRALGADSMIVRQAASWAVIHHAPSQIQAWIRDSHGVQVDTHVDRNFFPRSLWPQAHARPLRPHQVRGALGQAVRALILYPPGLVRRTLAHLKLCRALHVLGTPYGGTFGAGTVYLACEERSGPAVRRAFHHEFSSLLLRAAAFPSEAWNRTNAPHFSYGGGGRQAILAGQVGCGNLDLYRAGFFSPYARADLENDFNVFSETVLHDPYGACVLITHHPRLLARWSLWISFWQGLDSSFAGELRIRGRAGAAAE